MLSGRIGVKFECPFLDNEGVRVSMKRQLRPPDVAIAFVMDVMSIRRGLCSISQSLTT